MYKDAPVDSGELGQFVVTDASPGCSDGDWEGEREDGERLEEIIGRGEKEKERHTSIRG